MKLNELSDRPGARKRAIRIGRGIASGKGKTAGRGQKGQKSRSGVALRGREGGQMPIHMRLPKRGFHNPFAHRFAIIDIANLDAAIGAGKIDGKAPITAESLQAAGLVGANRNRWRLLGKGPLQYAIAVQADHVSSGARATIEAAGGSVEISVSGSKGKDRSKKGKTENSKKEET